MHVMKIFFVTLNAMQLSRCAGRRSPSRGFESLGSRMLRERGARGLRDGPADGSSVSVSFPSRRGSFARPRRTPECLPRKEVIQPHLPVRLPCYDFTPLTLHTFDASAPFGFGRRLRVQTTRVV